MVNWSDRPTIEAYKSQSKLEPKRFKYLIYTHKDLSPGTELLWTISKRKKNIWHESSKWQLVSFSETR